MSPGLKTQGKSASLSRAAKIFTTAQNELFEEAERHGSQHPGELGDPPQSPSSATNSGATATVSAEVWCPEPEPEPSPKRLCLEMVPVGKPGKPQRHFKPSTSPYMPPGQFFCLSLHGRQAAFKAMYKHATSSQNAEWLFVKLTGEHKDSFQRHKQQVLGQ